MNEVEALNESMDIASVDEAGDAKQLMKDLGDLHEFMKQVSDSDGTEMIQQFMKDEPAKAKALDGHVQALNKWLQKAL